MKRRRAAGAVIIFVWFTGCGYVAPLLAQTSAEARAQQQLAEAKQQTINQYESEMVRYKEAGNCENVRLIHNAAKTQGHGSDRMKQLEKECAQERRAAFLAEKKREDEKQARDDAQNKAKSHAISLRDRIGNRIGGFWAEAVAAEVMR